MSFELGPFGLDVLCRMVATSQLGPDDHVRPEREFQWQRVGDCIELQLSIAQLQATQEPNRPRSDEAAPSANAWYYRLGTVEHGPLAWDDLTELISPSGEVAHDILIRRQDDPNWTPFSPPAATGERLESAAAAETTFTKTASQNLATTSELRFPRPRPRLSEVPHENRPFIAALVTWLLVNSVMWYWSSDPYTLERRYLADLERIVEETHALQSGEVEVAEWKSFRQRSQTSLADVVRGLKKSAEPSKPARQQLLWAARDEIPRILGPHGRATDADKKVAERLQLVRRLISQP